MLKQLRGVRRFILHHMIHRWDPRWRVRIIFDPHLAVGRPGRHCEYRTNLDKESVAREFVFSNTGKFLDVGGRDGNLSYLLGNSGPLSFDKALYEKNQTRFLARYDYYGIDLHPAGQNVLVGDICSGEFLTEKSDMLEAFSIVYSNEVFEHLARPWVAAQNIHAMLKPGGICITIVPFSQRYHESPGDYYRYTPSGIVELFKACGSYEVCEAGFDTRARRYDWQGSGDVNDICPEDRYGAWRETWYSVAVIRKAQ